ncbi:MAG TPA: hypothetical protein VIA10_08200, partial [Gaiellaceae bacterium]
CRLSMRYAEGAWVNPFGTAERAGFGWGDGTVSGDLLRGGVRWANFPRRREDGVWTPNLRGVITTRDGGDLLVSIHGQSVDEDTPAARRAILARIELTTEAEAFRWLNTCFVVGEREIDEERAEWWLDAYVCVNETALGAPALGAEPPERFRQRGTPATG